MPRPNRARSIDGEANLAQRIRYEREGEGWSPADLARRMTEAGCSITTSAIYKIEARERTIKVDELIGLSRVFDLPVENLLTPMDILRKEWSRQRVRDLDEAERALYEACGPLFDLWVDIWRQVAVDVVEGVDEEESFVAYLNNQRSEAPAGPFWAISQAIQKAAAKAVVEEANGKLGDGAIEIVQEES